MLFYCRYVDDTFCLYHSEHDAIIFFDYINSRHPNIRFTMEREAYHKLPFLDVSVDNNDPNSFLTGCFREAYTGLPVVRVTENQRALNCVVLKYSIPVSEE